MLPTIQLALRKIIRSQPNSASWAAKAFQGSSKKALLKKRRLNDLIKKESQIGAKLFGELKAGHSREFFCLDQKTWVWQEGWIDGVSGKQLKQTVRYEVRDNGILKSIDGQDYAWVNDSEASNLAHAAVLYHQYVTEQVYGRRGEEGRVENAQDSKNAPHMQMERL